MRKSVALLLLVYLVSGCGQSAPSDEQDVVIQPDAGADTGLQDEPQFPEVWGAPALADENSAADVVEVKLAAQVTTKTLADGNDVEMYTYNGSLPGPLIQAQVGQKVIVHFTNELPEPTTIHWHGLRISDEMDGTPAVQAPIEPGESFDYEFVVPDAGSYWYHPHIRSNEQVEKGLYGLFIVRDADEPRYDKERYFTIDDILLDQQGNIAEFFGSHMEGMHGRNGNALLTNGRLDKIELNAGQNAVERWHLVNPANARTMQLELEGATWRVIGTDGGFLPEPYETDRITLPVGQRFDVEVTYDRVGTASLNSMVLTRDAQGNIVERAYPLVDVQVGAVDREPRARQLPEVTLPDREPTRSETIEFNARQTVTGRLEWTLNGEANPDEPLFVFSQGETVRIRLENLAGPEHPFHLHGQFFQVVDDGRPWTDQPGLKDTVLVPGNDHVEIIAYLDNPGNWMAHCHILEHAELGMMSQILVEETE